MLIHRRGHLTSIDLRFVRLCHQDMPACDRVHDQCSYSLVLNVATNVRGRLTLCLDICPGPFKQVDLHSVLPWDWVVIGEEAVRLPCSIPAAPR